MGHESLGDDPYPPSEPACDHTWKEGDREEIGWDGGGPGPGSGKGNWWYAVKEECTICHETRIRETT
jgi:hypothetical protein